MWCWRQSRGNQRRPTYQTAQERRQKEATLQRPSWEMGLFEGKMQIAEKRDEKEVKKKQMGVKQFVKMASDSGASTWVLVGVGVQCMQGHDIIIIMLNRW